MKRKTPSPRQPKPPAPSANPLVQPQARWQRTQRYVWDRKGGSGKR